jgi:hypothetical protein
MSSMHLKEELSSLNDIFTKLFLSNYLQLCRINVLADGSDLANTLEEQFWSGTGIAQTNQLATAMRI